ncbi:MAG TPA: hypothetical protein VGF45_24725 [Polyangia bacterium]
MLRRAGWVLWSGLVGVTGVAGTAQAQMSRAVLEGLKVRPPIHPFNHVTTAYDFEFKGNFDFWEARNYAVNAANQNANDPQNVAYVKYVAPLGSTVKLGVYFAKPVGPVVDGRDNCQHSHLVFGVWALQKTTVAFFNSYKVLFLGSSGEYGRRKKNDVQVEYTTPGASCIVNTEPDVFYPGSAPFIWGQPEYTLNFFNSAVIKVPEFYVAAQAATHGWGDCGRFNCFPEILFGAVRTK